MSAPACLAGLLLYLLDVQLRLAQRAQPIQLCSVTATSNKHLAALQLHADSRWKMQPIQAGNPISFVPTQFPRLSANEELS